MRRRPERRRRQRRRGPDAARAGPRGRAATLELWPGDDDRSCCSPTAVARAPAPSPTRSACAHDVVDERERASRAPSSSRSSPPTSTVRRPTPASPAIPGAWRALGGLADGPARRTSPRATTRASCAAGAARDVSWLAAVDAGKDQSYMLWRVSGPASSTRLLLPLGETDQARGARRRRARPACRSPAAREPGGVLRPRRLSGVPRGARRRAARGADRRPPTAACSARHGGALALHHRPAARPGRLERRAALRARAARGRERGRRRAARDGCRSSGRACATSSTTTSAGGRRADRPAALPVGRRRASRVHGGLRRPPVAGALRVRWRRPSSRSAPARRPSSTAATWSSAAA